LIDPPFGLLDRQFFERVCIAHEFCRCGNAVSIIDPSIQPIRNLLQMNTPLHCKKREYARCCKRNTNGQNTISQSKAGASRDQWRCHHRDSGNRNPGAR
jgi:hypothetical protein